jgi:hypothetical protein
MKSLALSVTALALCTGTALAEEISSLCYRNAAKFAEEAATGNYDEDGFYAYECFLAPNRAAVICDVSASKGEGDATDTYRVVMNKSCRKAFRVEMTGEE